MYSVVKSRFQSLRQLFSDSLQIWRICLKTDIRWDGLIPYPLSDFSDGSKGAISTVELAALEVLSCSSGGYLEFYREK